jgi:hypothetical protein
MEDVERRRHTPVLAPVPPAGKEHLGVDFESKPSDATPGNEGNRP